MVRPFFRDHFARLDRQIVLVDTLRALNAGPAAVADLETALTDILACFRQGDTNPLTPAGRAADRPHPVRRHQGRPSPLDLSHDRLEAILNRLVANATRRAKFAGAETRSLALAAIRATREGAIEEDGETLDVIIGTPMAGEMLDGTTYDGKTEIALFPGDLPAQSGFAVLKPASRWRSTSCASCRRSSSTATPRAASVLPHIRFDRALDFLIGDWLR